MLILFNSRLGDIMFRKYGVWWTYKETYVATNNDDCYEEIDIWYENEAQAKEEREQTIKTLSKTWQDFPEWKVYVKEVS